MAVEFNCPICRKVSWGNRNKRYCSDACRKQASRRPDLLYAKPIDYPPNLASSTPKEVLPQPIGETVKSHEKSGQVRTNRSNPWPTIIDKALLLGLKVSGIDIDLSQKHTPKPAIETPLMLKSVNKTIDLGLLEHAHRPKLSPELKDFFGNLLIPYSMLIWGSPGQGKSTFAMRLACELSQNQGVLYICGEENPDSSTFRSKVNRHDFKEGLSNFQTLNRVPTVNEWKETIFVYRKVPFRNIIYDSVNVLDMHSKHHFEMANEPSLAANSKYLGHIYISQAQKDGKSYKGDSSWGHDVDIVIRIENRKAIIEKNRMSTDTKGFAGTELLLF